MFYSIGKEEEIEDDNEDDSVLVATLHTETNWTEPVP
jgi:hypothetical protein